VQQFLGSVGGSQTTNNLSVKVDHQFNENSKLFVEYLLNPSWYTNYRLPWSGPTAQTSGIGGRPALPDDEPDLHHRPHTDVGSTLINEARASFSRQNQRATPNPDSLVDNKGVIDRYGEKDWVPAISLALAPVNHTFVIHKRVRVRRSTLILPAEAARASLIKVLPTSVCGRW